MSKSIMESLKEAKVVDYDPSKGITIEEMFATAIALKLINRFIG